MIATRVGILVALFGCGEKKQAPPPTPPPAAPAKPAAPVVYEDYPVGVGPCRFVGIKEISEIVGAQMQYLGPAADDIACHLVPAIGHAAARESTMATADEIRKEVPDLLVYTIDPGNGDWSGPGVAGIGDKAVYVGTKLQVRSAPWFFNIDLVDPSMTADAHKEKLEAIAKKLVARGAATPAGSGSAH